MIDSTSLRSESHNKALDAWENWAQGRKPITWHRGEVDLNITSFDCESVAYHWHLERLPQKEQERLYLDEGVTLWKFREGGFRETVRDLMLHG